MAVCCYTAQAQDPPATEALRNPAQVILFHQHAEEYKGGRQLAVTVYISAFNWDGLTAMGLYETVPEGWAFGGARAITGTMPAVLPTEGASGVLQFLWIEQSTAPITFQYVLKVPPRDSGPRYISGQVEYRHGEGALTSNVALSQLTGTADALPVIALRGEGSINLSLNGRFNDPGASATDAEDGDLSNRIEVAGTVDTGEAGSYTITYGVADSVGNRAVPVMRQVTVSDTPADPGVTPPGTEKPNDGIDVGLDMGAELRPRRVASLKSPEGSKFPPIVVPDITLRENTGEYALPLKVGEVAGDAGSEISNSEGGANGGKDFQKAAMAASIHNGDAADLDGAPALAHTGEGGTSFATSAQGPVVLILVALLMGAALIALWRQSRGSRRRASRR